MQIIMIYSPNSSILYLYDQYEFINTTTRASYYYYSEQLIKILNIISNSGTIQNKSKMIFLLKITPIVHELRLIHHCDLNF